MNNIHYKAYNRLSRRQELYRNTTYIISGTTLLIIFAEIITVRAFFDMELLNTILSVLSYCGLVLTAASLLFTMFQKEDLSEIKINHSLAAESYKELRDSYMLLIEKILSRADDVRELREESKNLQIKYSNIGKYSPTTTYEDYVSAQQGLGLAGNSDEEFTWSEDEVNRFLPKKLR